MVKTDKNIRHSFKHYVKDNNGTEDVKDYISIVNGLNKFMMDKVHEGYEVVIPARLGILSIVGTKHEIEFNDAGEPILPPDWVKTKSLWEKCPECAERKQLVYHTNDHTNGVIYKFFWSKKRILVQNKTLYSLRMTRDNKRRVHTNITNGKEYFIQKRK